MDAEKIAAVAKALAHPARVTIVDLLSHQRECRGADVFAELDLAQSTVSEHLKVLREAQVISATQVGTSMTYCLRYRTLEQFAASVSAFAGLGAACDTVGCDAALQEGMCE